VPRKALAFWVVTGTIVLGIAFVYGIWLPALVASAVLAVILLLNGAAPPRR
jgi:hypothetical protein